MLRKVDLSVARAVLVYGLAIILKLRETNRQTTRNSTALVNTKHWRASRVPSKRCP